MPNIEVSPAVWFSRHEPTPEQVRECLEVRYHELVAVQFGQALGAININDMTDKISVVDHLKRMVKLNKAKAIYGVFPAPIQASLTWHPESETFDEELIPCYSAWNVQRSVEGGKPTFSHMTYVLTGWLSII